MAANISDSVLYGRCSFDDVRPWRCSAGWHISSPFTSTASSRKCGALASMQRQLTWTYHAIASSCALALCCGVDYLHDDCWSVSVLKRVGIPFGLYHQYSNPATYPAIIFSGPGHSSHYLRRRGFFDCGCNLRYCLLLPVSASQTFATFESKLKTYFSFISISQLFIIMWLRSVHLSLEI